MEKTEKPERSNLEAQRIGNAIIFLALIGPFKITDKKVFEGVDLAIELLNNARLLPFWWDQLQPEQQVGVVQLIQLQPDASHLVSHRWKYMHPRAQDAFAFALRQRLRQSIARLKDAAKVGEAA
ncbi:MAG: hypothetical protein CME39_09800 [Haliea sp.]|nr:hypothetical protein [Haliea sp.]|tara:strand:- start:525 stop:896 length:372 start_codon:yes stop_codon:yes gene_type:complete